MDIKAYLNKKKTVVDRALESLVPAADTVPSTVFEAMRYSLFAGGKRVRPILAIASAEALGANTAGLLPLAASLELIHTYSLIHDDLPAMDNDDFRRGRPTCHKVYGEAMAILAGDGLLNLAFEVLSDPKRTKTLPPARLVAITREIARASGCFGMVGGQVVDMESEGKEIDFPTLEYIHTHKTGALIRASVRVGALYGRASEKRLKQLTRYGEFVGLAFQIADDILDITGTQEEIGKDVGSDLRKGKKTFPAFYGLEESRRRAHEVSDKAVAALEGFDRKADPLRDLARYIVTRVN
ncbi:MAG: polyprenyl synthetase family protein [Nitrospiraceae bacterium]|nr:polyprenyl synthetase family protein [Nitrospiraceae bacterium]